MNRKDRIAESKRIIQMQKERSQNDVKGIEW